MLVLIVTVMSVSANLPDDIMASSGIDRRYLLAGLLIMVTIALARYARLVLVLAVFILAVGANLPQEAAQALNIDPRFLMLALVAIVILSLANRVMKLPSGLDKPQKIVADHGSVALFRAVENGRTKIVDAIIKSGVNVDARSRQGLSALIVAASRGHEDIVRLLIDNGADLNVVNPQGQTALQIARLAGHKASVDALMVAVMGSTSFTGVDPDSIAA